MGTGSAGVVGSRGGAGGASHATRRAAPASPQAAPATLLPQPLSAAARARVRPRSHLPSGHGVPAMRALRLLTCGGWCPLIGLLLIGVSSCLLSYSILHPWPHLKLGLHLPWQPQGAPHTGRTVLSTFTSYLSAPELPSLASLGWAAARGSDPSADSRDSRMASFEERNGAWTNAQSLEKPPLHMRGQKQRRKQGWWRGKGEGEGPILEPFLRPLHSAAQRIPFLRDFPFLRSQGVPQGTADQERGKETAVDFGAWHANLSSVPDRRPESVRPPRLPSLASVDWKAVRRRADANEAGAKHDARRAHEQRDV